MSKKVFISQPMSGLDEKEILSTRKKEIKEINRVIDDAIIVGEYMTNARREFFESVCKDPKYEKRNWDIYWLGRSIEGLAQADMLWLCDGWEYSRGCNVELECAIQYGLEISYPQERRNNGE